MALNLSKTESKGEVLPPKTSVVKVEPKNHYVQKTIGNDTWLVMAQSQVELEDEWTSLYTPPRTSRTSSLNRPTTRPSC
jgi:hypothetical protein